METSTDRTVLFGLDSPVAPLLNPRWQRHKVLSASNVFLINTLKVSELSVHAFHCRYHLTCLIYNLEQFDINSDTHSFLKTFCFVLSSLHFSSSFHFLLETPPLSLNPPVCWFRERRTLPAVPRIRVDKLLRWCWLTEREKGRQIPHSWVNNRPPLKTTNLRSGASLPKAHWIREV